MRTLDADIGSCLQGLFSTHGFAVAARRGALARITFVAIANVTHPVLAPVATEEESAAGWNDRPRIAALSTCQWQLAVNLSSDRVRVALTLIEGIRNGQSLGAPLGYQFEKGLHDRYGLAEVDKFIYPLRKQFPLVADALASTQTGPDVPIEAIEARNVLDGKKLVDQITKANTTVYPWGVSGLPPVSSPGEQTALNTEADALLNAYDAIADLALAEGRVSGRAR